MNIPFVDLKAQYYRYQTEIDNAIQSVIDETAFIGGHYVNKFEQQFASTYGIKHCIGVGNGTDGIYISLKMLGVKPGDEVITATNSWIATSEAITATGANVVFTDIEENFFNIDPEKLEEKITSRTKAVIPVHLYGQSANIKKIKDICIRYNLFMIEDCAQAHFAIFEDQYVGTFGNVGVFSFYPGKNLGAYGDAGAVITDDDDIAEKIRMFANHGALKKHFHKIEGCNSRLDGIQAAILSTKLPHLHEWNKSRYLNAMKYNKLLSGISEVVIPKIRKNCTHVFHIYCILAEKREQLQEYLRKAGIATAIHYPTPLPFLKAYEYKNYKAEDFSVTLRNQDKILSLPMYPELTDTQISYISKNIKDFYN